MIIKKLLRKYQIHNLKFYSSTFAMAGIRSFVFVDCETTGLPFHENNQTKITEICFISVESDHISLGIYPRVMNKLTMCFNPQKLISPVAADITGLSNEILQYQSTFSCDTVELIKNFLDKLRKPVCFVAHNGNRFDYPILKAEIVKTACNLPDDILCIDSLLAFRELYKEESNQQDDVETVVESKQTNIPCELFDGFDEILVEAVTSFESSCIEMKTETDIQSRNELTPPQPTPCFKFVPRAPTKKKLKSSQMVNSKPSTSKALHFGQPSFKLADVYKRLTSKEPSEVHEAEGDVKLLIHCAAILGEKFVRWANLNFKYLKDIPKMTPGKRIGT